MTETETDRRVLHVTVGDGLELLRNERDTVTSALGGDRPDEPRHRLNFDSHEQLQAVLNAKNLTLLETIARRAPASIRELARFVDRNVSAVYRDLETLSAYGLVEFEAGTGRARRPIVPYDELDITVPLSDDRDVDRSDVPA